MSAGPITYQVFQGADGWYWRARARNGETLATSESYASKSNATRGARDFRTDATFSNNEIVILAEDEV